MFGLSNKSKPEINYTFNDGSRFISCKNGERRYYPLYGGVNTSSTHMTDTYLEWVDNHYESALLSMVIPEPYRVNHAHLFPGPATFRMLFTDQQKTKVAEFFNQLLERIHQEKNAAIAAKAANELDARRKATIDQYISVQINGQPAPISSHDMNLGAVSCPVCKGTVTTPGGEFDRISEALDDMDHIKEYNGETLTHCKQCNELYKVIISIKEVNK